MDYKEKIKDAIKNAEMNLLADKRKKDEALESYKKREQEELLPVSELIKEYLDSELKDSYGTAIRENYVITHKSGYPAYKVIKRGMQFIFGTPMFNPSLEVVTYSVLKKEKLGKKTKSLYPSDLKEMVIAFDDSETINKN